MSDVRVLVIAGDPLARAGLASLLATQAGLVVAGQVAGGTMLDGGPDWKQTDLVVWDLGWDPERGLEEMAQARLGSAPLVALVASEADGAAALALGARGALLRDTPPEALAKALVAVAHGSVVLDPALADALLRAGETTASPLPEPLTPRESQVLLLLAQGLPNKLIAERLDISENTVKFHVNAVLGKLGARTRTEAVMRATRLGLVPL